MIRQAIRTALAINWREIRLERSDKGKPFLAEPAGVTNFSFNLSHQGGYVVLGTSCGSQVGIDTMKVDMTSTKYSPNFNLFGSLNFHLS